MSAHGLLVDASAWNAWVDRLEVATETRVDDLSSLLGALTKSYGRFARWVDARATTAFDASPTSPVTRSTADAVVRRERQGGVATSAEQDVVMLEVVTLAARLAAADDSVLQLHLGSMRDVSPRLLAEVGRDAGADVMGDERQAPGLARFLGDLERDGMLPRTILYNLNPADNALFATMAGAFSRRRGGSIVQWGPPWWFNDHERGCAGNSTTFPQIGQLAGFVGMHTDSRSILSMTRHELFRRVLCDAIGADVEAGRIPEDLDLLAALVRDVCVDNAVRYFGFPPTTPSGRATRMTGAALLADGGVDRAITEAELPGTDRVLEEHILGRCSTGAARAARPHPAALARRSDHRLLFERLAAAAATSGSCPRSAPMPR